MILRKRQVFRVTPAWSVRRLFGNRVVAWLALWVVSVNADIREMVYMDDTDIRMEVAIAMFGNQLPGSTVYLFNGFLPPEDVPDTLCSLPDEYNDDSLSWRYDNWTIGDQFEKTQQPLATMNKSIALFVNDANCTFETKARNALKIQDRIPLLKYVVVYGTKAFFQDVYVTMRLDYEDQGDESSFNRLAMVYLPSKFVEELAYVFNQQKDKSNESSPYLFSEGYEQWDFVFGIFGSAHNHETNGTYKDEGSQSDFQSLFWFRFVLFGALILTPCLRACYLWHVGGGRLRWQRNDRGWIVGLQYIPPVPWWLTTGRIPTQANAVTDTLTQEQFDALPEIKYQAPDPTQRDNVDETIDEIEEVSCPMGADEKSMEERHQIDVDVTEKVHIEMHEINDLERQMPNDSNDNSSEQKSWKSNASVPTVEFSESAPDQVSNGVDFSTSSTICSICIDDFEEGETLTLLPRCKHAFHKQCIQPWLLERQGCCPFCKTKVLPDFVEDEEASAVADESHRPSADEAAQDSPPETNPR
jgi:hypothetical protein